jgi:hypothetical protein
MMRKSEGKTSAANQWTPGKPGAAKATSTAGARQKRGAKPPILINASTKGFLLVDVCKGATKQQLIQAIDQALETSEIPYFTNNSQMASGQAAQAGATTGAAAKPQAAAKPAPAKAASQGWGEDEALLMLVRQEGW